MKHRTFKTGAIRDTEDEKPDLVETKAFLADWRYAKYMTEKKKKYGSGNFKKGIPIEAYERSLMRHIYKYFMNKYEGASEEPNEDHLAGARFNLDGIMFEEERARQAFLDAYKKVR